MTEKKTFKNPFMELELDGACWVVTHSEGLGSPYGQFHRDQWDMEVTFTKKPEQFKAGDKVRSKYVSAYSYTVLVQHRDYVVVYGVDDDVEIFEADELVRIS